MAQYGYVFDRTFNPNHQDTYTIFCNYFGSPDMAKVKDDPEKRLSTYMVKISCLLLNECRYIVAMVPLDGYPVGTTLNMSILQWRILQTRSLSGNYKVPSHSYQSNNLHPYSTKINVINRTKESTTYQVKGFPFKVSLLHSNPTEYEYPNEGTISTALETYKTVIML